MADYIKRDEFLKTWCESYCRQKQNCREDCSFYDAITQFPAADVRENVRGRWEVNTILSPPFGFCSVCSAEFGGLIDYNYCPNCGADMRGEKDD